MDAADQLLLSEGICRLLGIVNYHSEVEVLRGGHKNKKPDAQPTNGNEASVPTMSKISTGTTPSEYHCSY